MNREDYILDLIKKGYSDEDIKILVAYKYPDAIPAPAPAADNKVLPQEYVDRLVVASKKLNDKIEHNEALHGVTNITDLTTGDAIYAKVEVGRIYFMAVDRNKQYLMQGLCISKDASTATFVGYSWNTAVKHTNTVWATADKGRTQGDTLGFMGVDANDLSGDENALANVALVKLLLGSKASGELKVHTSTGSDVNLSTMDGSSDDKKLTTVAYSDLVYATKGSVTPIKTITDKLAGSTITFEDGTKLVL